MKTVFITGAGKGLGYCLAQCLAERGLRVFAGYVGDGARLKALSQLQEGRVLPVAQDVTSEASIAASVSLVQAQAGGLDLLINNAGVQYADVHGTLGEVQLFDGSLEKTFAVNAFGPLRVTQAFLPLLRRGEYKRIVTITSEAGSISENWRDYGYGYCMSKAAANMFCQIMQRALRPESFKILVLHPGWLRTDMGSPDAHLTPETSALCLVELILRDWSLDEPFYLDYTGCVINW